METNDVAQILRLARAYAAAKSHALSTVSLRIAGQGSLFGRLESDEAGLTIRRRDHIFQQFSDHWPFGTPWPADIPRPAASPGSPSAEAASGKEAA